jgi:hypothetical protein
MADEVNWDNVQWGEPVKYNPAEGIPPARPTSCPEAQLLEWLLTCQSAEAAGIPLKARDWSSVAGKVAPLVSDKFLKASQFPGLYQALGLPLPKE